MENRVILDLEFTFFFISSASVWTCVVRNDDFNIKKKKNMSPIDSRCGLRHI